MSIRRGVGLGCGLMLSVLLALLALALVGALVDVLSVGAGRSIRRRSTLGR